VRGLRVGLVLGGGGLVGLAYHAAALTALEHDLGWDARSADVIVGTSAGSIVACLLRRGVPASDLAARAVGVEPAASPPPWTAGLSDQSGLPPWSPRSMLRPPRLPGPALVARWTRRPWRIDPISATMGLLANGLVEPAQQARQLDEALGPDWPDARTWICAVRQHDLRRVVFGHTIQARPTQAVMASCAVPGYFAPIGIDGVHYLDGGIHSPTNAAVLADEALDLVIVVSPMSGHASRRWGIDGWMRRYARAKLDPEVRRIERRGTPAVVLEPGPAVTGLLAGDFMDTTRLRAIVGAAFLDTGSQLIEPRTRTLLAGLAARPRSTAVPST
jgi:NTE family protein